MLVLITYDINVTTPQGRARLRRVARQCVNYGTRVQNSVFECVVDMTQLTMLKHALLEEIDLTQDSLRFYRLGEKHDRKVEHFGVKQTRSVEEPMIL